MNRKTIAYILLIPTLVMLLHAIVPHHHHFDDLFKSSTKKTCKKIHKEQQKNSKACYAFNSSNILIKKTLDKANNIAIKLIKSSNLQSLIKTTCRATNDCFVNPCTPIFETEFFGNQISFRGPPCLN